MSNDNVIDTMTFEEAMNELEKLVESLDKGDISLDQAISAYDKGSRLKDLCQKKLNEAKMKVLFMMPFGVSSFSAPIKIKASSWC